MTRPSRLARTLLAFTLAACTAPTVPPGAPPRKPAPSARPAAPSEEAWRKNVPPPGPARPLTYPAPEQFELDSGLELWILRRPARVATLSVVIRHGQSSVPAGKSGLAALTARMLTEGTRDKSATELAEAVEALGTTLEHDTGRDDSSLSLTTLLEDVPRGLDLLAEAVQRPAFAQKELARVKRQWKDGLLAERQSPMRLATLAGLRLLFGPSVGAPVGGSIPDVEKLTRDDLAKFHRAHYRPSECALVIVGDVTPEQVRPLVSKAFGSWRPAGKPPPARQAIATPAASATRVTLIDRPGSVQSALFVALDLPPRSAPGHEARELMSGVVGGLFTSRINKNLREVHAYTYGARSDIAATRYFGAFMVQTNVETAVTADALKEIVAELRKARDPSLGAPLADEEVSRARADIESSLGAHLEHPDRMAEDLAEQFVHDLPRTYYAELGKTLAAIDTAAVGAETRRLDPDKLVVVVVGDRAAVQPALEQKGFDVLAAPVELTY